ncbi:hypothetical protein OSTOST_20820 [Ostertagia ostertagi]
MSIPATIMARQMFITTTIVVIFFTVFLQGITIRPLVNYLNVETKDDRPATMTESVYNKYLDYMMSGVEDIAWSASSTFSTQKVLRRSPLMRKKEEELRRFLYCSCLSENHTGRCNESYKNAKSRKQKDLGVTRSYDSPDGTYANKGFEKDLSSNDMTVTPQRKQLDKVIASGESVDGLYALFSELLDRKLKELNTTRGQVKNEPEDGRLHAANDDCSMLQNIRQALNSEALQLNDPYVRNGRRQSTGGMKERKRGSTYDRHAV